MTIGRRSECDCLVNQFLPLVYDMFAAHQPPASGALS
ncbi:MULTISPECIES: hypothetical protein [Bacillus]